MPFTNDEMQVVLSWTGTGETEAKLNERYERLEDMDAVIVESLRYQIAVLRSSPASLRLPSGLSINTSDNIKALEEALGKFVAQGGTSGSATNVTKLVRADWR